MSLGRIEKTLGSLAAIAAFAFALTSAPSEARAQTSTAVGVNPMGKGTAGGILLGGEVVCITLGAVGVEKGWPYLAFGGLGMVGGGVGGYFVDKATSTAPSTGEDRGEAQGHAGGEEQGEDAQRAGEQGNDEQAGGEQGGEPGRGEGEQAGRGESGSFRAPGCAGGVHGPSLACAPGAGA